MQDRASRRSRLFYVFYWLTVAAAVSMLLAFFRHGAPAGVKWGHVACFLGFLLYADTKLAELQHRGGRLLSTKSIDLAVIVLFGPAVAAGVEAVSSLMRGFVLRRVPPQKAIFNAAMLSLSSGAAGLVYRATPWHDSYNDGRFGAPLLLAIVVYAACNLLLLTVVLAFDKRVPAPEVFAHSFGWSKLRHLTDAPFAAMVILSYSPGSGDRWWVLALYAVPILLLHQADRATQEMKRAHLRSIAALTIALEGKEDPWRQQRRKAGQGAEDFTGGHSFRVSQYALRIGRALGLSPSQLEVIEYGGLLHDIGKLAISNDILLADRKLTPQEHAEQARHPEIGEDIVRQIESEKDKQVSDIISGMVLYHHERPDGKGYPKGLSGTEIPLEARILGVCDAFDAMTKDRPYRPALPIEYAMEELVRWRGTQFDAQIVDVVLQLYQRGEFGIIHGTGGALQGIRHPARSQPPVPEKVAV